MGGVRFDGARYDARDGESVLDVLLRHGVDVPYSCRKGTCFTCVMVADGGAVPEAARRGLKETETRAGWLLACQCPAEGDIAVSRPGDAALFGRAVVRDKRRLAANVCGLTVRPATALYYHAGQFINLRRGDGLTRSYSLASVPQLDSDLEIHVRRLDGGAMSGWVFDSLAPGDEIDLQGPLGSCYYLPGRGEQNMLLVGTGTGLAPLLGIARDALESGHSGPIALYHGSRAADGLYLRDEIARLAEERANFAYHACVSGPEAPPGCRAGRADAVALADHPDLAGWRVHLCGYPPMVAGARKAAYLAGAALADIHADPFDLRDLRAQPRAAAPPRADVW